MFKKSLSIALYSMGLCFLYENSVFADCVVLPGEQQHPASCRNTFGEEKFKQLLKNKKAIHLTPLQLITTQGASLTQTATGHQLTDLPVAGEHFAVAKTVHLSKGFHAFVFETAPTQTELYIYMIGQNSSVLIPWLNAPLAANGWTTFGKSTLLQPVFSQMETDPASKTEKIKIAIYSPIEQTIELRWQHGQKGVTVYQGTGSNRSTMSQIQVAEIRTA